MIVAWPVVLLVAGDELVPNSKDAAQRGGNNLESTTESILSEQLNVIAEQGELEPEERTLLINTAGRLRSELVVFSEFDQLSRALNNFWNIELHPKLNRSYESGKQLDVVRYSLARNENYHEPEWYLGFTNDFLKTIKGIDRKLQGRILEALRDVTSSPTELKGNTKKPLTSSLKGLWRYRIGDHRLLYKPDESTKHILVLAFGPRSRIYDS